MRGVSLRLGIAGVLRGKQFQDRLEFGQSHRLRVREERGVTPAAFGVLAERNEHMRQIQRTRKFARARSHRRDADDRDRDGRAP